MSAVVVVVVAVVHIYLILIKNYTEVSNMLLIYGPFFS